ncbi:MAG: glycosyltransferase [Oscillospiraceae bacterium]|nr:glycosyltransferase [Oscillospiraceae bacterium]
MKKNKGKIYLSFLILFSAVYLVWRIGWTIPTDHGALSVILSLILLITELVGAFEMFVHFYISAWSPAEEPSKPTKINGRMPDVDVFVPTYGEPTELLRNTLTACLSMHYDNPERVHIYLCDDADREEMRILADELGVKYFSRRNGKNAKAGNLNAAMAKTGSPLIAVFDADMCPHPDFLMETVPYFLEANGSVSRRIGFVQTPQSFRNADLFQSAFRAECIIPNEQDYFYRSLEPARNRTNSVIFGGSNTLLSRRALQSAGGFTEGTLTEDFATGIEIQKKGYRCLAIAKELADGLSPESLSAMIRQRSRWARGCIQSGRKTRILTGRGLSFVQRVSYLSAVGYWYNPIKRLVYLLAPISFAVFGVTVMRCNFQQMLIFWLPMYLLAVLGIRFFSGGVRTAKWSDIYDICMFPFLLLPVIGETLGFSKRRFVVTDKSGKKGWSALYLLPFLILIALSVIGIIKTVSLTLMQNSTNYLLLLFWLIFNLYELLFAFVFVCSCGKLPASRCESGFVHDLGGDKVLKTNLLSIILRILFQKKSK